MLRKFLIALLFIAGSAHANCELERPVRFAGLDWDSNKLLTEMVREVFEVDFDCATVSFTGGTLEQFDDLRAGELDVMMEVWETNFRHRWRAALTRGQVVDLGGSVEGAVQGWFVPRFMVEGDRDRFLPPSAPDLRSVADLTRYAHLFRDPENPRKGRFYNCPLGWSCEIINSNKLRAYGLQRQFSNYRPRDGKKLAAALLRHYERAEPFVTYYWGPSWLLGARELIQLEEPAYDEAHWNGLVSPRTRDPKGSAYPSEAVRLAVHADFAQQAPQLVAFLRRFSVPREALDALLAEMRGLGVGHRKVARRFLAANPQLRQAWLGAAQGSPN